MAVEEVEFVKERSVNEEMVRVLDGLLLLAKEGRINTLSLIAVEDCPRSNSVYHDYYLKNGRMSYGEFLKLNGLMGCKLHRLHEDQINYEY